MQKRNTAKRVIDYPGLVILATQGMYYADAAEKIGCSKAAAREYLLKNGWPLNLKRQPKRPYTGSNMSGAGPGESVQIPDVVIIAPEDAASLEQREQLRQAIEERARQKRLEVLRRRDAVTLTLVPDWHARLLRGASVASLCREMQCSPSAFIDMMKRADIDMGQIREHARSKASHPGVQQALQLRLDGWDVNQVAQQLSVSTTTVRNWYRAAGLNLSGERAAAREREQAQEDQERERKSIARYGLTRAQVAAAREDGTLQAWRSQRNAIRQRNLEWDISLAAWLRIWQDSGKMHLRGRGKEDSHILTRIDDTGAYTEDNVHVVCYSDVVRDMRARAVAEGIMQRKQEEGTTGVYLAYPGTAKPWMAKCGRTVIGTLETQEEAIAARADYMDRKANRKAKLKEVGRLHVSGQGSAGLAG